MESSGINMDPLLFYQKSIFEEEVVWPRFAVADLCLCKLFLCKAIQSHPRQMMVVLEFVESGALMLPMNTYR